MYHLYVGIVIISLAEILLYAGVKWVGVFFTPLVWTGYILLVDGIVFKLSGRSLIVSKRKEFALMIPLSAGFWYLFEAFNLFIRNWHYEGLPGPWTTAAGMTWAFATIGPALMETRELLSASKLFEIRGLRLRPSKALLYGLLIAGVVCLGSIPLVPRQVARHFAIPLWMGFILLLDPINYLKGRKSIIYDWQKGQWQTFLSLFFAGLVCGFLWELWNYWALARWIYEIPYAASPRIFEMPLLGYCGFPLLAIEYYAFYSMALNWKRKIGNA